MNQATPYDFRRFHVRHLMPFPSDSGLVLLGPGWDPSFLLPDHRVQVMNHPGDTGRVDPAGVALVQIAPDMLLSDVVASAWRALQPGGAVAFLVSASSCRHLEKALPERGFTECRRYGLIPSAAAPRLLLPLSNPLTTSLGLELYNPVRKPARWAQTAARAAARIGLLRNLVPDRVVVARRPGGQGGVGLLERLGAALGADQVEAAVHCGSAGEVNKATLQIMTKGSIAAYAKVGGTRRATNCLLNEGKLLRRLAAERFTGWSVPKVISEQRWDNFQVLLLSAPEDRPLPGPTWPDPEVLQVLVDLGAAGGSGPIRKSAAWERLMDIAPAVVPEADLLRVAAARVGDVLGNQALPLGISHGDFVPWNVRRVGRRLWVIDFEWGREQDSPCIDLYHFLFHGAVHVGGRRPGDVVRRLFLSGGRATSVLATYFRQMGMPETAAFPLFLLYLAHWILLDSLNGNEENVAEHRGLLRTLLSDYTEVWRCWCLPGEPIA